MRRIDWLAVTGYAFGGFWLAVVGWIGTVLIMQIGG
jgi:hypothetical protein